MEIVLEKTDALNAKLKVNLTEADYQSKVAAKLKEVSKTASLKGFRPGKVPASLMQKMYGKGILVDEINNMLSSGISEYIKENKIEILGDPLPETKNNTAVDWENQKDFEFGYELGLVPQFTYNLSALKLNKYEIAVDADAIAMTLGNAKKQFGKSLSAEISVATDVLTCEITSPTGYMRDGDLYLERMVAKNVALFVGKKKDDVITAEISTLFEEAHLLARVLGIKTEEAAEYHGQYSFKIVNIERKEDAEVNQEFFDKMFGKDVVTDEPAFMAKMEEFIKENYLRECEVLLNRDIKNATVDSIELDLPKDFLKRWLLVTNQGKITEAQIEQEIDMYIKELKWNLIKNKVAKDFDLKVEHDEIFEAAKNSLKRQFGGMEFSADMEETVNKIVENQLQQDKGKAYMQTFEELLAHKVTALISSQVALANKKISINEFETLVAE